MQHIHVVFDSHIIQMAICEFFLNALKIDCFILKVPLLLFIALPETQRKWTKGWGIAEAYRCSVKFQCYKLFVKDTYDWRQLPLLRKKLLEKDSKHSILMTWYHEGYIRHFHIDHNTPFNPLIFCITNCIFILGTGFIKKNLTSFWGLFKDHIRFSRITWQGSHFTDCTKIHISSPY